MEFGEWRVTKAGVLLVALDVSHGIDSHALEWAIQKAVRPNDRLILLALFRPLPPISTFSTFKLMRLSMGIQGCHSLSQYHCRSFTSCSINRTPISAGTSTSGQEKRSILNSHPIVHQKESKVAPNMSSKGLASTKTIANTTQAIGRRSLDSLSKRSKQRNNISSSPLSISTPNQEDRITLKHHLTMHQKESKVAQNISTNVLEETKTIVNAAPANGRRSLDVLSNVRKHRISTSSTSNYISMSPIHEKDGTLLSSHLIVSPGEFKAAPKISSKFPESTNAIGSATQARGKGSLVPISRPSKHTINISSSFDDTSTTDQEDHIPVNSHTIVHKKESKVSPKMSTKGLTRTKTITNTTRAKGKTRRSKQKSLILDKISSLRRAMPVTVKQLPPPPPLCSVCKHRAPEHTKPPRRFNREEVEEATNGYAAVNFLGEGGFGLVYRGVLEDGQVVAVKKHRQAGLQGALEFCTEIEVLSCVQHRNLVKLMGYCVEHEWLLVYEYACNGSLDKHLHGDLEQKVIDWKHRQKVAVGSARGLRYLHDDCRVGCIIHRDFRPKNILLTHDFEPMVGDFGLARWQIKEQSAEETRIMGAIGYLAPEYLQTGKITEKTDVYAFGVMLMELITGVKALELNKREWKTHLNKMVNSSLESPVMHELIDSRLEGNYDAREADCMMRVAVLCIQSDPDTRPSMSKVLRMLEDIP